MESTYGNAVITASGKRLRNAALYDDAHFTFTRFGLGNGHYEESEKTVSALESMTELKNPKNYYLVNGIDKTSADVVKLSFMVTNFDPDTGEGIVAATYTANEIGLFAKPEGSDDEVLYSICVCTGDAGDTISTYNGYNPLQVLETYNEKVGNSENVTIDVSGAYALAEDLETEAEERAETDFKNLYGLCNKTTAIATVSGNKQITESGEGVTAVTVIVKTSETVKTITATVTPEEGDYIYTQTTVITKTEGGKTITESYARSPKPQQA